jgi:hypothetical protein
MKSEEVPLLDVQNESKEFLFQKITTTRVMGQ